MNKIVIYSDNDVEFSFEDAGDGIALLHCTANTISPSKLKLWYSVFANAKQIMKDYGFNRFMTVSPNPKFCEMFGGKYFEDFGTTHKVYVWELD